MGNFTFPNAITAGDLFRTDGLFANTNTWRMFTGANPAASMERFNLTVPATTSNLQINTPVVNSNIFLNANGNNIIQLTSTAGTGNNGTGQVLIQPSALSLPYIFPLMNLGGTIRFSEPLMTVGMTENILMYGYTTPIGVPGGTEDGFRIKFMNDAQGVNNDCLIFEKTDGNNVIPDGCIMFTNRGNDPLGIETLSMTIEGNGHVGVGADFTQVLQPTRRLTAFDDNAPQFRIVNTLSPGGNTQIFTDFQTTGNGNLEIDPRNAGLFNIGSVRINYGLTNPVAFPGLSLDVNGQVNIRTVNQDDTLNQVLVWEPISGNVRWRDVNTLPGGGGTVTANNGTTIFPVANNVQWGQVNTGIGTLSGGELIQDTEIPTNGFNTSFYGLGTAGVDRISFGQANPNPALFSDSKVFGWNNAETSSGHFHTDATTLGIGTVPAPSTSAGHCGLIGTIDHMIVNIPTGASRASGVYGLADGTFTTTAALNIQGVFGEARNNNSGNFVAGVVGIGIGQIGGTAVSVQGGRFNANGFGGVGSSYGVATIANGGQGANIGGIFNAEPTTALGGITVGVYGNGQVNSTGTSIGVVGVGGNASFYGSGPAYSTVGWFVISDSTVKNGVTTVTNPLAIINSLNPVEYNYDVTGYPQHNLPEGNHFGFIAQEVESVIPEIVNSIEVPGEVDSTLQYLNTNQQIKAVNYTEIIPLLVGAVQEQQSMIQERDSTINSLQQQLNNQQQQIDDLAALINNCCNQGNGSLQTPNNNTNDNSSYNVVHNTDVRLSDTYCVLGENSPNPFKDNTVINYTLSETIKSAQVVFYNTLGQVIKVVELNDRGEGRLNVYAEDLRSGMYTYSLIIDGNVCESKKMIKE